MANNGSDFTFTIIKHIATIGDRDASWPLELNYVSFNDDPPKYDIRKWNKRHDRMSKGIGMTEEELRSLMQVLNKYFDEN
jgi:hypothetical protein